MRKKLELREENEFVLRSVYGQGRQLVAMHPRMLTLGSAR